MKCHRCNTEMVKGRTQSASTDTFFGMFFEDENDDMVRKSIFGKNIMYWQVKKFNLITAQNVSY